MMVLVRKNELACREHWDGGLWEPREAAEPAPPPKAPASTVVAESPAGDHSRDQFTDRVTSVGVAPAGRPTAEPIAKPPTPASQPAPSSATSQPVQQTPPITSQPSERVSQASAPAASALRRESWGSPAPEIRRAEPSNQPRVDTPRVDTPRVTRPVEPAPTPQSRPQAPRDDTFGRAWGAPRAFDEDQIRPVTPRPTGIPERPLVNEPTPAPPLREQRSASLDDRNDILSRVRSNEAPSDVARREPDINRLGSTRPTSGTAPQPPNEPPLTGGRRGWTEPFQTTDAPPPRQREVENRRPARAERRPDVRPPEVQPSPEPAKVAQNPALATMPHCCGTCRDFRPADGGERGWCNNPYAFDHRRMVRRNDLACRSTIGDWWIPTDDWWLQQADYSHHGRPTPIVDNLLRQLLEKRANGTTSRQNGSG